MGQPKVLHIHGGRIRCGVATHILQLMQTLPQMGVIPFLGLLDEGEVSEEAARLGIDYRIVGRGKHRDVLLISSVRRLVRDDQIGLIHTHTLNGNFYGRVAGLLPPRYPVVTTIHTDMEIVLRDVIPNRFIRRLMLLQNRILDKSARLLIVPSRDLKARLKGKGVSAGRMHVVHNGLDMASWGPDEIQRQNIRSELGIPEHSVVLTFVGRLVAGKRIDTLIDIFARLCREYDGIRLLITGDGPKRESLVALARSAGLERKILLTGFRKDIPKLMAASDIYVHPSEEEALPYVLLEAMASGLPIAAFLTGGVGEVVDDGVTGILARNGDVQAFKLAIEALLRDPARARTMGDAGRRRCAERFSATAMGRNIALLYHRILNVPAPRILTHSNV